MPPGLRRNAENEDTRPTGCVCLVIFWHIPIMTDSDEALSSYQKSLTLAKKLGMQPLLGQCHLGMGYLSERLDRQQDAAEHREAASTIAA